jgi:hypothetical protein
VMGHDPDGGRRSNRPTHVGGMGWRRCGWSGVMVDAQARPSLVGAHGNFLDPQTVRDRVLDR